jgi:multimeric flavodoxin WrbA
MDAANPRFSGSDHLLNHALKAAREVGAETRMIKLNDWATHAGTAYNPSRPARRTIAKLEAAEERALIAIAAAA